MVAMRSMSAAPGLCAAAGVRDAALAMIMSEKNRANLPERVMRCLVRLWGPDCSRICCSLPRRDSHVSGINGDLEAGQEAHAEQAIDALSKETLDIILNDDRDFLGLQRAQLNRCGPAPFCHVGSVGGMQSDDAVGIDLHLGLLRERALQAYEGRA